jgi:hypothetical protein
VVIHIYGKGREVRTWSASENGEQENGSFQDYFDPEDGGKHLPSNTESSTWVQCHYQKNTVSVIIAMNTSKCIPCISNVFS